MRVNVSQKMGVLDHGQMFWSNFVNEGQSVRPGETPQFSFELPPGTYRISVSIDNSFPRPSWGPTYFGGTGLASEATEITVTDGAPLDLGALTVLQSGVIRGQVTVVPDVYKGAGLELFSFNSKTSRFEYYQVFDGSYPRSTADDGTFEIDRLPPGRYRLRIEGDATLAPMFWPNSLTLSKGQDIVVTSGVTQYINAMLVDSRAVTLGPRIAGANRYETAVAASQVQFPSSSGPYNVDVLYIASGANYPDALVAGPVAHHDHGALLLVNQLSISPAVWAEAQRLHPKRIVIVGGTPSVSEAVESQFRSLAPTERIGGTNRYDTARKLVRAAFGCGEEFCAPVVFVATGANYPDALAAGPAAGLVGAPIILVDGVQEELDAPTVELLDELGSYNAHVLGSSSSVSDGIFQHIQTVVGWGSYRYGGANRYETSALVNEEFFERADTVFVATGTNFPDALAAGPLASSRNSPLYLTQPTCAPQDFLITTLTGERRQSALERLDARVLRLIGGPTSISDTVATQTCP